MPHVTEKPRPGLFFSKRLASNVSNHQWIRPHRCALHKILEPVPAQLKPLGFKDRHRFAEKERSSHCNALCGDSRPRLSSRAKLDCFFLTCHKIKTLPIGESSCRIPLRLPDSRTQSLLHHP